ncbi:hypothetical protein P7C70_g2577, partial [Phenoliferia sp. Uapishka_3]
MDDSFTDSKHPDIKETAVASLDSDSDASTGVWERVHWFRGVQWQIWIIGCVFLCAPGMYNALSNLGAGGLATPYWNNASAAAGYVFMCFSAVFGGVLVSKLGVPLSLFIASTGDIIYAGTLYANSASGINWPLMVGSIWSGCTDGYLYAIEGPIVVGYPEPRRRGFLLGIWVALRNAGPVIGGAIILGLNHGADSSGAVSLKTYIAIIAIMCCGPFIALLISRPERVQRKDGVKIAMRKTGWRQGGREWCSVAKNKNMYLLFPLFFCSWFSSSYTGTLQTIYFTVRTRSLFAFVIPFADIASGFALGAFLDCKRFTLRQKMRWTFWFLIVANATLWTWTAVITHQLDVDNPTIDWSNSSWMGKLFPLWLLFDFVTMLWQTFLFWMLSEMSSDFLTLSYATGTLRGVECAGQAVAYGVKSSATSNWISVGLNMGLIAVSIPFAWSVFRRFGGEDPPRLIPVGVLEEEVAGVELQPEVEKA